MGVHMLTKRSLAPVLAAACALTVGAGCAGDDGDAHAVTAPTTTAAGSLAPACLPVPALTSLTDDRVTLHAGQTIDLGVSLDRTDRPLTVERLQLAVVPATTSAETVEHQFDDGGALDGAGRVLVARDQHVPGEIRLDFDGRDDAGQLLPPGDYRLVVGIDYVGDDERCPDADITDGPYAGLVRQTVSGELGTLEVVAS
jgi:hypothetical protein